MPPKTTAPKSTPSTSSSAATSKSKPKFIPRPPLPKEEKLKKLYASLVDQVNDGYLEKGMGSCRKILALDPTSTPTFKTLLFLLLQTDQYSLALQTIHSRTHTSEAIGKEEDYVFERAYCLYRLHREEEALELLVKSGVGAGGSGESKGEGDRSVKHLRGQILYRAGKYAEAEEIYNNLLNSTPSTSPETQDILQNLTSTTTYLSFSQSHYLTPLHSSPINPEVIESEIPALPGSVKVGVSGVETSRSGGAASGSGSGTGVGGKVGGIGAGGKKKRRHRLPKGAVENEKFTEDPDRWLPKPLRRAFAGSTTNTTTTSTSKNSKNKKKGGAGGGGGGKEISGLGVQGSLDDAPARGGGGGGGGGGKGGKKGKKGGK